MHTTRLPVALLAAACLVGCSSTASNHASPRTGPPAATTPATTSPVPSAPTGPTATVPGGPTQRADDAPGASVRKALDTVRSARSFRLVVTIREAGAPTHVEDNRVVRGTGAHIVKTDGDTVTEDTLYVGGDVHRRTAAGIWEHDVVREDSTPATALLYRDTSVLLGDLYELAARPEALTPIAPLAIDGTTCVGLIDPDGSRAYLTPGEHPLLRRLMVASGNGTIVWDLTELDAPVDLTPPTTRG
ncbi:hypothetical protein ACFRCG_03050 [Embleya sp. NPDC056575]|uniref:hypothetical protein n=1 Tax=unclassified Embleya TaxID=2699296 RepID=UPI0036AA3E6D